MVLTDPILTSPLRTHHMIDCTRVGMTLEARRSAQRKVMNRVTVVYSTVCGSPVVNRLPLEHRHDSPELFHSYVWQCRLSFRSFGTYGKAGRQADDAIHLESKAEGATLMVLGDLVDVHETCESIQRMVDVAHSLSEGPFSLCSGDWKPRVGIEER